MVEAPLHPAWRAYRRRWWLLGALLLGYLPVVASGFALLKRLTQSETPGMVLALTWMLVYAASGVRVARFPCPACGEPFHLRNRSFLWGAWNPRARRCVHCGFPKWHAPPRGR
jgi:ribosomal protein L37E